MVTPKPDDFPRITPYLYYKDVGAACDWLIAVFGFRDKFRMPGPDGVLTHAELSFGDDGVIMLGKPGPDYAPPASRHGMLYVYVDDVDAHFARARGAGATILEAPADQFYGDRRYMAEDLGRHQWCFATRVREVSPEEMAQAQA
jgi:PhnB protein